ncbi:heme-binding protein [Thermodesulfobacteriota bacterium]
MLAASVVIFGALQAVAVEEPSYKVLRKDNNFEIRDYAPNIIAETVVEVDLEQAGSEGSNRLKAVASAAFRSVE